jgi:hypothetical protein
VARSAGGERLDPTRLADFSLMSRDGRPIPLDQIGHSKSIYADRRHGADPAIPSCALCRMVPDQAEC